MTLLKSLLFLILTHGLLVIYLPVFVLVEGPRFDARCLHFLALPFWIIGGSIVLWCIWIFTFHGQGTPAPLDPPLKLVDLGLYRHVRNPIYIGVMLLLAGHIFWFGRLVLILYTLLAFIAFHLAVILYEEPTLRSKFGAAYADYCRRVPRWIPRSSGA